MDTPASRRLVAQCYAFICVSLLLAGAGETQTFFTEVTEEIGVPLMGSRSTSFGDYDNDGWPDMFCAESVFASRTRIALLHNETDGRFVNWTTAIQADVSPKRKGVERSLATMTTMGIWISLCRWEGFVNTN